MPGGLARYAVTIAWPARPGAFPWSTLTINVTGSFGLALLLVLAATALPPSRYLLPFLGTGFFGAYTTFSTFALAGDQLAAHGHARTAAAYLAASLLAGLACGAFGAAAGRAIAAALPPGERAAGRA